MGLGENRELMYTLITDRTEEHVARLKALLTKRWQDMTDAEKEKFWNGYPEPAVDANGEFMYQPDGEQVFFAARGQKGAYNYSDINRVLSVIDYLHERLFLYGYYPPKLVDYGNWGTAERPTVLIPSTARLDRYCTDIQNMRGVLPLPDDTPKAPEDLRHMTTDTANNIEKILWAINEYLNLIDPSWVYSGEVFCGEV